MGNWHNGVLSHQGFLGDSMLASCQLIANYPSIIDNFRAIFTWWSAWVARGWS